MRSATFAVVFACLISVTPNLAHASSFTAPANGATVSGLVTVSLNPGTGISWSNFFIDNNYYSSTPPLSFTWDTTKVANGTHSIQAVSYSASNVVVSAPIIRVTVSNGASTGSTATTLKLSSPTAGAQVSGTITIAANNPSGVQWENFYIDGSWIASSPPFSLSWNTNQVANGSHTISVVSYGSAGKLASASASVTVANTAPALATPTSTPTVTRTSTPVPTRTPTVTPTPVPTKAPTATLTTTATPVPTVAPTPVPTVAPTTTPTLTPTATPTAITTAAYYVSTSGSDGNNGMSLASAWRTIQHAVNTVPSGETVIVEPGTYSEHVSIVSDGVTLQGDPNASSLPVVDGFDISAQNVTVNGFEITFQTNATPGGYGIYIHDASNVVVENNYIHDLCHDGIFMEPTASNVQALNNKIVHAQMSGIEIDGTGNLVEGNDISATYQHPSVLGGVFAVCTNDGGSDADADAIRFFGSNHVIRANYLHDIEYDFGNASMPNPNPHIDCFQTWGASGESTSNILVDRNWCVWPSNGAQGTHAEISSIEALDGAVGNITYQNNVFQDMIRGVNATQDGGQVIGQLNFYNNTFDHITQEAIVVDGARSDNVENNIFYDIVGGDGFIAYTSGEHFLDNVFYTRAGAPGSRYWGGGATPPFQAVDPLFVNDGNSTGVGANYNLCVAGQNGCAATSTIGHAGATLSSVPTDYDGAARSGGYSIGAYQISQ